MSLAANMTPCHTEAAARGQGRIGVQGPGAQLQPSWAGGAVAPSWCMKGVLGVWGCDRWQLGCGCFCAGTLQLLHRSTVPFVHYMASSARCQPLYTA